MTTAEIIQTISTTLAVISAICSTIVCTLTFKTTKPALKIKIDKKNKPQCVFFADGDFTTAIVVVVARNNSNVVGEISEAVIRYKGKKYCSRSSYITTPFSVNKIKIVTEAGLTNDPSKFICTTPKSIKPYSEEQFALVFQHLPKDIADSFVSTISFRVCGRFFKHNLHRMTFVALKPDSKKVDKSSNRKAKTK